MKLTVPEAARRAGRSPETIRRWIWSGRLPSEKIGNQHFVEEATLEALLPGSELELEEMVDVPGSWGEWLRRADALHRRLRARGAHVPPAAELLHRQRRSH